MKPSLELRVSQQLTMTPQLQQAIKLLQLSTLELQTEIQEQLDTNPLLEVSEDQESSDGKDEREDKEIRSESDDTPDTSEELNSDTLTDEAPIDTQWDELSAAEPVKVNNSSGGEDDNRLLNIPDHEQSLRDELLWQLNMTNVSERDKLIAVALIDNLDERGYLEADFEEVISMLPEDQEDPYTDDELLTVLHLVQSFDPPGVAARDLKECLTLQLDALPLSRSTEKAVNLIADHFQLLAKRDYKRLMKETGYSEDELREIMLTIQRLDPNPGHSVGTNTSQYVVPDVFVKKVEGQWRVELNPDCVPKIGVNSMYAAMIKRGDNSKANDYLKDKLQDARWFIKSLFSRNETLMKVSTCIVEEQLNFFEYGAEAMKPLVLHHVADKVELHESTVSRVTNNKYMHTPRGIFELKYFFSSHVSTSAGGECSATAIRAFIQKLIDAEESKKPLSDNKIAAILQEQGINVARRTVAKYREALSIPPSSQRKSLI